jgi:methionyl-tRNA formyltransferase
MRVAFFGTPEFALPSLQVLHAGPHQVVGVVSAPPKPQGRGMILAQPAIAEEAVHLGLPLLQPGNLRDSQFLSALEAWKADIFAVVAFRILPPEVFSLPQYGTINLHGSLLPAYRGAAPIQWAIWNGDTTTGLTTFRLEKTVDTGNLLKQATVEISAGDDAGTLAQRMAQVGSRLLLETLTELEQGTLTARPQDASQATLAPKITKEHRVIDWNRTATQIRNQARALSPEPGAHASLHGQVIKIYRCEALAESSDLVPGEVLIEGQTMVAGTGSGALSLTELQVQGKSRMDVRNFLRGYRPRGKFQFTK